MGTPGPGPDPDPLNPAPLPPAPACSTAMGGGSATVQAPTLLLTLKDRYEEAWLASPAVADLDLDGKNEIIVPREGLVVVWKSDGSPAWRYTTGGSRIWASPVVADFRGDKKLEIAVAARDKVYLLDAAGQIQPGFPVTWQNEMRALAAGDVDGDGQLDLVATVGKSGPTDVLMAWHADGTVVPGFPPNGSGSSGCSVDNKCYLAGCYDQNLAIGDLDRDNKLDLVAPHDNAYASIHKGSGAAFDGPPGFPAKKTPGIRYLHSLAEAMQGYSSTEATSLQAHFTNTAPAIADLDGDGNYEVVMLGSAQNAAQTMRELGVGLWAVRKDASRLPGWETPLHVPKFVAGLWDPGNNIVGATNQVSIGDLDPQKPGPEIVFAGFDGAIHAASAGKQLLWNYTYTTDASVLTGGVAIGEVAADSAFRPLRG